MYSIEYSRKEIGRAGERLIQQAGSSSGFIDSDVEKLHAWRMLHLYPLDRIKFFVDREAKIVEENMLASSRIKRFPSIINKLQRFPEMKLHKMQDLGGCRVILSDISKVYALQKRISALKFKHKLVRTDDYMVNVKSSGYRSLHMVFSFENDKHIQLNGLRIEIQIRTAIQHSWATAVEMVGLFRKEALKSSQGDNKWLRFFQLVSELFYRIETEGLSGRYYSVSKELLSLNKELNVVETLSAYNKFINHIEKNRPNDLSGEGLFILVVDTVKRNMNIGFFNKSSYKTAAIKYKEAEKYCAENKGCEVAMVSVADITNLRAAYPAYFLDTKTFINNLGRFVFV